MNKSENLLYTITMNPFVGRFYIAYYEKGYLILFLMVYFFLVIPASILTFGTDDSAFVYFSNGIWLLSFYLMVIKSCLSRGEYIKKIKEIEITNNYLMEKDVFGNILRRISYKGRKVSYKKRSEGKFDLVIKGGDYVGGLFENPLSGAVDFGSNPYIYIANNIDIEHLSSCKFYLHKQNS